MATTGTAALSAEVKAMYDADFYIQGQSMVFWDQISDLKGPIMNGQRGISQNFPIVESNQPNYVALDELTDVSATQMRANEVVVTLQEYGGAIEVTKFAVATAYADVYKQAAFINGYNLAESFDYIVRAVAGQGSRVMFQNSRTTRAQFAGQTTAADVASVKFVELLAIFARNFKMPMYEDNAVATIIHPFLFYDMLQDTAGGGVRTMSQYSHPEILFNAELAYWGGMRIIVSANAKGFWGAGAAAASPSGNLTLTSPINVGDATLNLSAATNLTAGMWVAIQDGQETGNTWFDTNELMRITGVSGNTVSGFMIDPGPGDAGGARFAHASGGAGTIVTNRNSVFPIVVVGPNSITKAASSWTGPFGETVVTGPYDRLGRFLTFGWYAIVGWARTRNAWLLRGECGSSQS